jgi:hypothetical protein
VVCENEGLLRTIKKEKCKGDYDRAVEAHWSYSLKVKLMHSSPKGAGSNDLITASKILRYVFLYYLPQ